MVDVGLSDGGRGFGFDFSISYRLDLELFNKFRSIPQGCFVLPMLYVLALEPFLRKL